MEEFFWNPAWTKYWVASWVKEKFQDRPESGQRPQTHWLVVGAQAPPKDKRADPIIHTGCGGVGHCHHIMFHLPVVWKELSCLSDFIDSYYKLRILVHNHFSHVSFLTLYIWLLEESWSSKKAVILCSPRRNMWEYHSLRLADRMLSGKCSTEKKTKHCTIRKQVTSFPQQAYVCSLFYFHKFIQQEKS